jgi:hypothetical protein
VQQTIIGEICNAQKKKKAGKKKEKKTGANVTVPHAAANAIEEEAPEAAAILCLHCRALNDTGPQAAENATEAANAAEAVAVETAAAATAKKKRHLLQPRQKLSS